MEVIPLSAVPAQTLNVVLDGQNCTISIYWRQTHLYLDLAVGSTIICTGWICQNKANVLQVPVRGFNGSLHFWDVEGDRAPQWENLGSRYFLVFVLENEDLPKSLEF